MKLIFTLLRKPLEETLSLFYGEAVFVWLDEEGKRSRNRLERQGMRRKWFRHAQRTECRSRSARLGKPFASFYDSVCQ